MLVHRNYIFRFCYSDNNLKHKDNCNLELLQSSFITKNELVYANG